MRILGQVNEDIGFFQVLIRGTMGSAILLETSTSISLYDFGVFLVSKKQAREMFFVTSLN